MNTQKDYDLLFDSEYFYDCIMSENQFEGTLSFSGIHIRITAITPYGYRVYAQDSANGNVPWNHLLDVADILSVFGVITDLEDIWLKERRKRDKKKTLLHEYVISV